MDSVPLKAVELFKKSFQTDPEVVAFAPGRVEILGNHTDYNEGFVLPLALNRGTAVAAKRSGGKECALVSDSFDGRVEFGVDEIRPDEALSWANYPKGVMDQFSRLDVPLEGLFATVASDVPVAAGLSSSAALEVSMALIMQDLLNTSMEPMEMAKLCQRAENEFVGVRCGILDQFSSIFGRANCGLFLDCRTLEHDVVPMGDARLGLVICDTLEKHTLISSKYNERRQECEEAAQELSRFDGTVTALRDVSPALLDQHGGSLREPALRRARHVVEENLRVLQGMDLLKAGKARQLGEIMFASHESSRTLFENSSEKLDFLVDASRDLEGVVGAKLCGGGFGGCTVHLVEAEAREEVASALSLAFDAWAGYAPGLHICAIGGGARAEAL